MKLAKRLVSPDSGLVCPDHWSGPDWVLTEGPIVAELNAKANFTPDPQQELGLDMIFAVGPDGLPASFAFCVICCRQNMKTGLFKQAALGFTYIQDMPKVVWSAHEMSTTLDAQKELAALIEESPALSRRMPATKNRGVYADNGGERIELKNGQQILFKARTISGGRGLSGDKVILDEAFALKATHVGSLLPTMTARPHGQVLYGSSAGKFDSKVLRDVRDRGRNGTSPRLSYAEWGGHWRECGDPDCTHPKDAELRGIDCVLDDRELRVRNNPTVTTGRISEQTLDDLRQELPPEEYARECFGRWDDSESSSGTPAIDIRAWKGLADKDTPAPSRGTVVLDVAPDRSRASIGLIGPAVGSRFDEDGAEHPRDGKVLAMVDTKPGISWVVPALVKLQGRADVLEVALHPRAQAGALIPALKAAEIEYAELTHTDIARGCTAVQLAVVEGRLLHLGQLELDGSVAVARTRWVSEAEVWDRRDHRLEISPLASISTALHRWDLLTAVPDTPPPPPRRASRSAQPAKATDIAHVGF